MLLIITLVVVWLILGYIGYGIELHEFTTRWPYFNHAKDLRHTWLFGPIALAVALFSHNADIPIGLRFTPLTIEERWEAFHKEFPTLARETFDTRFRDLGA